MLAQHGSYVIGSWCTTRIKCNFVHLFEKGVRVLMRFYLIKLDIKLETLEGALSWMHPFYLKMFLR